MEGRCGECFWQAEDYNDFIYCNCPYAVTFTADDNVFMGLICNCFKSKEEN